VCYVGGNVCKWRSFRTCIGLISWGDMVLARDFYCAWCRGSNRLPLNDQLCLVAGSSCWVTKHCRSTALDNLVALASYIVHIISSVHMPFRAPWKGESWGDHISTFLFQHSPLNHNLKKKKVCTQSLSSKELVFVYMHGNSHYTCIYIYIRDTDAYTHTRRYICTG